MYNSKRFETVKNIRENKKISNVVQAAIGVLAVVLAALIVWMMVLVSGIQGTARVVNYAGLVARRNATPCQNGDCGPSGGRDDGERGIVYQRSALRR